MMNDAPENSSRFGEDTEMTDVREFYKSESPVYVSSEAFATDAAKKAQLMSSFPIRSGLAGARVAVFGGSEVTGNPEAIKSAYNSGAIVAITDISSKEVEILKGMGHPTAYNTYDSTNRCMVAYDKAGHNYVLINNGVAEQGAVTTYEMGPEESEELDNAEASLPDTDNSDDTETRAGDPDNGFFSSFAEWCDASATPLMLPANTRGASTEINLDQMQVYLDQAWEFPRTQIGKFRLSSADYYPAKTMHFVYNYKVLPLHVFNGEGKYSDMEGDYYIVSGTVKAQNGLVYGFYQKKHGAMVKRARGWYCTDIQLNYEMVDKDGNHVPTDFYGNILPGTTVGSSTSSEGFTWGFSVGLSGFKSANFASMTGTIGFNFNWTHSITRNYADLESRLHAHNGIVDYDYIVRNLPESKKERSEYSNKKLPMIAYNDLECENAWCWRVAAHQYDGVKDYGTANLFIKINIKSTHQLDHWAKDSGKAYCVAHTMTCDSRNSSQNKAFIHELGTPNRIPNGTLNLRNSSEQNVMAHIKIWKADANGNKTGDIYKSIDNTLASGDYYTRDLPEGTYYIEFDMYDNDSRYVATYCQRSVKIQMGNNERESITNLSLIGATKVKKSI